MKKLTCVLAILAAASTAAVAKDLKQDKKATVPTVAATQMTDAEMDQVTAAGEPSVTGEGTLTAIAAGATPNATLPAPPSGVTPGQGTLTAASTPGHL